MGKRVSWSKEVINSELKKLSKVEKELTVTYINKNNRRLYQAILRHYGDWETFNEESSVKVKNNRMRKKRGYWTEDRVVKEIQRMDRNGEPINSRSVQLGNSPLFQGALNIFGSWEKALEGAGKNKEDVMKIREGKNWTKDLLIKEIVKHKESGHSLEPTKLRKTYSALYDKGLELFGSWETTLRACGYNPYEHFAVPKPRGYWTEEKVLEVLSDRVKRGKTISSGVISKKGFGTLYRKSREYFGTWKDVCEAVDKYIEDEHKERLGSYYTDTNIEEEK